MSKPRPTVADFMVMALSPALIMGLVGSLCFFLIEVFYRGKMMGSLCWVMFWFIIGIVLVSRIAIESSQENATRYGLALAAVTWIYLATSQPAYIIGIVLLAVVWFCANKLVFDCTLIDEDVDSSGQGLLQKSATIETKVKESPKAAKPAKIPVPVKPLQKPARKWKPPHSPGRWVVYFSLAAIPLFGVGQMVLPAGDAPARRTGFMYLTIYLASALGLLVTTSFLGLRRYLRQRFLRMPATIALAWLKFGVSVILFVLIGSIFLPRPGVNEAWTTLRYQIDYRLRQASQYASPINPPGTGEGRPGNDDGGKKGEAPKPGEAQKKDQNSSEKKPGETPSPDRPTPSPMTPPPPVGSIYNLLRTSLIIIVALIAVIWIFRRRYMLLEMIRSIIAAIREFFIKLFEMGPIRKPAKPSEPVRVPARHSTFAEYKNPFFAAKDHGWPPEEIMIYTYEAVRVWAKEQGIAVRAELTAREFCRELGESAPELNSQFNQLAFLYAHAAYGKTLPPGSDLEPIKELWRRMATTKPQAAALS